MRALLDANVLISFFDSQHICHKLALEWFKSENDGGWATCPITENAVLRVLTNPNYSKVKKFNIRQLIHLFRENMNATDHTFWPDDISLVSESAIQSEKVLGHKQLTDVYLLALAVKNSGRLVTFDERISIESVTGATRDHLLVL
jgi:toxin-antitoxin system PIN domain toxin